MNYLKFSGGSLKLYFDSFHSSDTNNLDVIKILLLIFYSLLSILILPNIPKYRYSQLKLTCAFPLWTLTSILLYNYFRYKLIILLIVPFHALLYLTLLNNSLVCLLGWSFSISCIISSSFVDRNREMQLAEITSIIHAITSLSFFIKPSWFIRVMRISGSVLLSMGNIDLLCRIFDCNEHGLIYLVALMILTTVFTMVIFRQKGVENQIE